MIFSIRHFFFSGSVGGGGGGGILAGGGDIVGVAVYFLPGMPKICSHLPSELARNQMP
jgi:hypothetical protein